MHMGVHVRCYTEIAIAARTLPGEAQAYVCQRTKVAMVATGGSNIQAPCCRRPPQPLAQNSLCILHMFVKPPW